MMEEEQRIKRFVEEVLSENTAILEKNISKMQQIMDILHED